MRRVMLRSPVAVAGVVLLALGGSGPVPGRADEVRRGTAAAARAVERSALSFLPEPGLPDAGSRFVARGPGYGIAVAPDEVRVAGPSSPAPVRMRLVGARADATGRGELPRAGRTNLFLGEDPASWRTNVGSYGRVMYAGVWDGIDVVYHGRGSQLEQDFIVSPGADAAAISLSFADSRGLRLAPNGDLVVAMAGGEVRLGRPTLYQEVDGRRRPVSGAFALLGDDRVGFQVGSHDPDRPLVIDPVLLESSYLGGSGNDAAYGVAVDDAGHVYLTGYSESTDFPTASPQQGALVEDAGVRTDAFVAKLNPQGDGFVYSTFLGGKRRDAGHAIAVGVDGSAVIGGYTESSDFPLARPIVKAFAGGPSDAFVARISPEGAVLQYSTYVGGSGTDTARGVALSPSGDAYLVGSTTSGNFPVAGSPLRGTLTRPDDADAFVTRIDPAGSAFVYSTYMGGNGEDHGLAVAVDPVGNAYVTGDTRSPDLPTAQPFQPGLGGGAPGVGSPQADAFVFKLDANGSSLLYSTYLGGGESDQGASIAVDGTGNAYVTGSTGSTNFPVVRPAQPRKSGDFDAFVAKLSPEGPLFWSTYLGGSASDGGGGVAVDGRGRASVTGAAASSDFPTVDAFQASKGGGFVDGFVATYDEAGAALTQSSYLGGGDDDQGTAIAVDGDGHLRVTGTTRSSDLRTARPFQPAKKGDGGDAFLARIGDPPPAAEAEGAASSPARDRRIRIFLGTTIVLFLAAIGQTLWLRRRPPAGPPVPAAGPFGHGAATPFGHGAATPFGHGAGVGDMAVTRVDPDWYAANRPPPPRLRDIAPVRPQPAPPPSAPRRGRRAPTPDGPRPDEVVVPDLLPEGEEGLWASEPGRVDAPTEPEATEDTAPVPAVADDLPPAPPPIDVSAPDLWGPSEPEPALADDSVWAELLGADPAELGSLRPPPSASAPRPPPPGPVEIDEAVDGAIADALQAEAPAPPVEPRPAAPPPPPPPPPRPQVPPPHVRIVEPSAPEPASPPAPEPEVAPPPARDEDLVVEVVVSPADAEVEPAPGPPPPEEPGAEEPAAQEVEDGDTDWMTALWGRSGPPVPDVPEPDLSEPAGRQPDLSEPAGRQPGSGEELSDRPGAAGPADLSISDLLAEDLPIPETEDRALSIHDLLAEDLAVPDAEAPPPPEEALPPPAPPAAADEEPPGADAQPPAPVAEEDGTEPADVDVEAETASEGEQPSRPLPEAAPGRSLGGRLRRARPPGRES